MFCIAAFIVLLLMAAVSAKYRKLLGKAWNCTFRRVTFRACDTSFKQDIKDRILAPVAIRNPRAVKTVSFALEVAAFLIVVTTVVSLYIVVRSGLNLAAYGTCDKQNAASCSIGAQSCSLQTVVPTFGESLVKGDVVGAVVNEAKSLGDTISAIPGRMRHWDAKDYLPKHVTYLNKYDASKPTALEIVDPGCFFCKDLFQNIEKSGFADSHNLAVMVYPIGAGGSYKFPNSLLATQYIESMRIIKPESPTSQRPADWRLLARIYSEQDASGTQYQTVLNAETHAQVVKLFDSWLQEFGYSQSQIKQVKAMAASSRIAATIAHNRHVVEDKIKTVKIPTIIFGGSRHDGLVSVDELRKARD